MALELSGRPGPSNCKPNPNRSRESERTGWGVYHPGLARRGVVESEPGCLRLEMAAGCLCLEMAAGFAWELMGPCFESPWP